MNKLILSGLAALTLTAAAPVFAKPPVVVVNDDPWNPAWGEVVPAPHGWSHKHHWNHHVGLCHDKYPTYDMHRDMYKVKNRWVRCTLY